MVPEEADLQSKRTRKSDLDAPSPNNKPGQTFLFKYKRSSLVQLLFQRRSVSVSTGRLDRDGGTQISQMSSLTILKVTITRGRRKKKRSMILWMTSRKANTLTSRIMKRTPQIVSVTTVKMKISRSRRSSRLNRFLLKRKPHQVTGSDHGMSLLRFCEHATRCTLWKSEATYIVRFIALSRFF